jgi:hypothetical protein
VVGHRGTKAEKKRQFSLIPHSNRVESRGSAAV